MYRCVSVEVAVLPRKQLVAVFSFREVANVLVFVGTCLFGGRTRWVGEQTFILNQSVPLLNCIKYSLADPAVARWRRMLK